MALLKFATYLSFIEKEYDGDFSDGDGLWSQNEWDRAMSKHDTFIIPCIINIR